MVLVVSLRNVHDASPTNVSRLDPQAYIARRKRQTHSAHQGHQLPDVRKGCGLDHATFETAPRTTGSSRYLRVRDNSTAQGSSHRRADDRDHRGPRVGGTRAAMKPGLAAAEVQTTSVARLAEAWLEVGETESRGREGSSDGRKRRNRPREDASRASSSCFSTNGSRRAPVPQITSITSKRQVVPSLGDVASSVALLGRLTMSDDRAMPVSPNPCHARTSAFDSAAVAFRENGHHRRKTCVQTTATRSYLPHFRPPFSLFE